MTKSTKSAKTKKHIYELALLCINSPMYYALYKDRELCFEAKKEGKILDCLHSMQCELQEKRIDISAVYYARGPGNLSALKLAHTFLHTLAVVEGVKLHSCDSFALLGDVAIFAYGKRYFIKQDEGIECVFLDKDFGFKKTALNVAENMDKNHCIDSVDSADFMDSTDSAIFVKSADCAESIDCASVATTKSKRKSKIISTKKSNPTISNEKISNAKKTNAKQAKLIFDYSFDFRFPCKLDISLFTSPCEPLYILPAV
ncbi:hypothetical protein [Helicobacter sp. T3_23-1056]